MTVALAGGILLAALVTASPTPPASTRTVTDYDVRYGPLRVLTMHATVAIDGKRYRAESEMRTVGVVRLLFPWTAQSTSEGMLQPERLQPIHHVGRGDYRGERRAVVIDYGESGAVTAVVEPPPEADWRDAVPVALQQQTIDPLTASLAAVAFQCRGVLPVFDGRRRYDMQLSDLGDADLPSANDSIYRGRARHCRATIAPLAGFWRSAPQQDERPTTLDSWIAAPRPDLPAVPVYLELSSPRGTLAIDLRTLTGPEE